MKKLTTYIALGTLAITAMLLGACTGAPVAVAENKEIQTQRAGDLVIALLNEKGELAQGQNRFVIAFRSAANNQPVDVGTVTLGSSMTMPGMAPMLASIELQPAGETGQYAVTGDFGMSGAWRFEVRWDGPAGQGSTSFSSNVR